MKMLKNKHSVFGVVFFITGLLLSSFSFANQLTEKQLLIRIQYSLDSLMPLINAAERQQDPNQRIQVCYSCLRKDIATIKKGINQIIHGITIEPRVIAPIEGDYLSMRGAINSNLVLGDSSHES